MSGSKVRLISCKAAGGSPSQDQFGVITKEEIFQDAWIVSVAADTRSGQSNSVLEQHNGLRIYYGK